MFVTRRRKREREAAEAAAAAARERVTNLEAAHRLAESERVGQLRELKSLATNLRAAVAAPVCHPVVAGMHARAQDELEEVETAIAELAAPIEPSEALLAARDALRCAETALRDLG